MDETIIPMDGSRILDLSPDLEYVSHRVREGVNVLTSSKGRHQGGFCAGSG